MSPKGKFTSASRHHHPIYWPCSPRLWAGGQTNDMCGIAAIVNTAGAPREGVIERMARRLDHRGPDATRSIRLHGCDLGHTRLSIIDLAGGAQPMPDEAERFWVIFNGEIFNYRELRSRLESH